jgi:protein-disulfide isomerase
MECPYCARFYLEIERKLVRKYEGRVNAAMIHLPLARHRFAQQSATAVECGAAQGAAASLIELVYSKQDSIGLKSWESYAQEAKMPEVPRFLSCLKGPIPRRIEAGKQWAARLQVASTPTILLNGWRFFGAVPEEDLSSAIDALLAGRQPFS